MDSVTKGSKCMMDLNMRMENPKGAVKRKRENGRIRERERERERERGVC